MDRQLLERMIGAGVLMFALIIIAPAILDGQRDADSIVYPGGRADEATSSEPDAQLRTHTIVLDRERDTPPVARERSDTVDRRRGSDTGTGRTAGAVAKPTSAVEPQRVAVVEPKPKPKLAGAEAGTQACGRREADEDSEFGVGWSVQLGSFAEQANAQRLADEVGQHGFDTFLMPLQQSGRTLYRVRVGPSETRNQAAALAGSVGESRIQWSGDPSAARLIVVTQGIL